MRLPLLALDQQKTTGSTSENGSTNYYLYGTLEPQSAQRTKYFKYSRIPEGIDKKLMEQQTTMTSTVRMCPSFVDSNTTVKCRQNVKMLFNSSKSIEPCENYLKHAKRAILHG
ncbi:unnamed protein product [Leptidea sinapis]|uniref:Uncharacterized protein n=1 Tax=Leptidea sinapis TaxID=189913 RepID=A0A5E4R053_9NEOP|nr:unnamed protein product [Leptidea sinapis]